MMLSSLSPRGPMLARGAVRWAHPRVVPAACACGWSRANNRHVVLHPGRRAAYCSEPAGGQKLDPTTTALFLCDMQEKFAGVIDEFDSVVSASGILLQAANELGVPAVVTEQYPRGLGRTVPELSQHLAANSLVLEKLSFSMACGGCEEDQGAGVQLEDFLQQHKTKSVLLCGVETHVCVLQTALDLILHRELSLHVVVDAVSSQRKTDREVALHRLKAAGAVLTTAESAVFQLLGSAKHPSFKTISKMVQQPRVETSSGGLLGLAHC